MYFSQAGRHRRLIGRLMQMCAWQRFLIMALPLWTILLLSTFNQPSQKLFAQTPVSGAIVSDTTWTEAGSPYLVQAGVVVSPHVTLTIEAGVEVRADANRLLAVEGALLARGTAEKPVLFTGAQQNAGAWQGIHFIGREGDPAQGDLEHVIIEYGGAGSAQAANVTLFNYADVSLRHSIIRQSGNYGLYGGTNGTLEMRSVQLQNNDDVAVVLRDLTHDPVLVGLSGSGNGVDAVSIDNLGTDSDLLWENTGLPYIADASLQVQSEQTLTVEPGVEVRFGSNHVFHIAGELLANGTVEQPITFTGVEKSAGSWQGIHFAGAANDTALGELQHVIVEYGGAGGVQSANLGINFDAYVTVRDAIIRHSINYGIFVGASVPTFVVVASQIVDNGDHGIHTANTRQPVQAPDNWWGSPSGPVAPDGCNPNGMGESVSDNVLYLPFRTAIGEAVQELPAVQARLVSIAPRRWYVPTNFPVYVDVTVTDENGWPVAGETVQLLASGTGSGAAQIQDGGVTNASGKTFAIITGRQIGELALTAELGGESCRGARSATTLLTITGAEDLGLTPNAQAPYLSNDLEIDPMPVMRGVPTTVRATLINPNDFAITVDGQFSFAQLGIGLTFGPLDEFSDIEIPANGETTVEVLWFPSVSGHYCVRLDYFFSAVSAAGETSITQSRRIQRNLDVAPGPFLNRSTKNAAQRAKVANDAIGDGQYVMALVSDRKAIPSMLVQDQVAGNILDFIYEAGAGISCALGGGDSCRGWDGPRLKLPGDTIGNLQKDPPRQDYRSIAPIDPMPFTPVEPGEGMSQARADALNELTEASLSLAAQLIATVVTHDRFAGASEANDQEWASLQANYYDYYLYLTAQLLDRVSQAYVRLHHVLVTEGVTDVYVTADDYRAYQERLQTQGFTATEVEAAHQAGLTDTDLEAIRQRRLALDPEAQAGSLLEHMLDMARAYGQAADMILIKPNFTKGGRAGVASLNEQAPLHNLVSLASMTREVQVGNPTSEPATVDLRVRPVDLPPDWSVVVSPTQVLLAPGQVITAEVTVRPGLAAVQGESYMVAVEGFIDGTLLGGVAVQLFAPEWVDLDAPWSIYLPSAGR